MRSVGSLMPLFAFTYTHEWRKKRDGNTGIAMKFFFSLKSDTVYEESDSYATSNSWYRSMRKKVSSTGMLR